SWNSLDNSASEGSLSPGCHFPAEIIPIICKATCSLNVVRETGFNSFTLTPAGRHSASTLHRAQGTRLQQSYTILYDSSKPCDLALRRAETNRSIHPPIGLVKRRPPDM